MDECIGGKEIEEKIKYLAIAPNIQELKSKEKLTIKDASIKWCEYIISMIGEPIIKSALEDKLKLAKIHYQSEKLKDVIEQYDMLSAVEKKELIAYIINKSNKEYKRL